MKKLLSMLLAAVAVLMLSSCFSTSGNSGISLPVSGSGTSDVGRREKLYITEVALPGDGSGLMPGTFTLTNGTRVPLGAVIYEGDYLYTSGSAKVVDAAYNVDYLASSEQARMVCREALANYLDGNVSTSSSRSSTTVSGRNTTSSGTKSVTNSTALLQGMEDCGYGLGPDGTSYVLCRVRYN